MNRPKFHNKLLYASLLMLSIAELSACNHSPLISPDKEPVPSTGREEYVKDELIVKFREGTSEGRIREITTSLNCNIIRSMGQTTTYLLKIEGGEDVKTVIEGYKKFSEVEFAQPNYMYHKLEGK